MSIQIKPLEESTEVKDVKNTVFDAEMYSQILTSLQKDNTQLASQIISNALSQGNDIARNMVAETKKELLELQKLATAKPVMHVKINTTEVKKLETEAVPYLGRMIINAKQGINTLLVGPAGCGKTHAANQLAKAMGLEFGHLNLTAGASETWLFGRQTPTGFIEGTFSRLYKKGGVFLGDEMDAADSNLLLCVNTAIAGNSLANPISGEIIPRHKDFVFVGAANTFGKGADSRYTGRSRLDAATLDRFVMIKVDYNTKIEEHLCTNTELRNVLWKMREKLNELGSQEFISTRAMQIAQLQLDGGVTVPEILDSITLSWPEDIVTEIREDIRKFRESGKAKAKKKTGADDDLDL